MEQWRSGHCFERDEDEDDMAEVIGNVEEEEP